MGDAGLIGGRSSAPTKYESLLIKKADGGVLTDLGSLFYAWDFADGYDDWNPIFNANGVEKWPPLSLTNRPGRALRIATTPDGGQVRSANAIKRLSRPRYGSTIVTFCFTIGYGTAYASPDAFGTIKAPAAAKLGIDIDSQSWLAASKTATDERSYPKLEYRIRQQRDPNAAQYGFPGGDWFYLAELSNPTTYQLAAGTGNQASLGNRVGMQNSVTGENEDKNGMTPGMFSYLLGSGVSDGPIALQMGGRAYDMRHLPRAARAPQWNDDNAESDYLGGMNFVASISRAIGNAGLGSAVLWLSEPAVYFDGKVA